MPVLVEWYDPDHKILLIQIQHNWTWPQMHTALEEVWNHLGEVKHGVYTIFDARVSNGWPPNSLANLRQTNARVHPNSREILIVGLSIYHRTMLEIYNRFYGNFVNSYGLHQCATLEDAEDMIGRFEASEMAHEGAIRS